MFVPPCLLAGRHGRARARACVFLRPSKNNPQTVEGSSNFVDDIRRLRKAGGLYHHDENAGCSGYGSWSRTRRAAGAENARARRADAAGGAAAAPAGGKASLRRGVGADGHAGSRGVAGTGGWSTAFAPRPVCTVGGVEPLALARELGIQTIVDRITRAIVHDERSRAPETRGGTGGRSAGRRVDGAGGGQEHDRAVEAGLAVTVGNIESYGGAHDGDHARLRSSPHAPSPANQREQVVHFAVTEPPRAARSFTSSPPPPGGHGHGANRTRHPEEDIERLRRVVRNTMSSPQWPPTSASSTSLYDGGAPLAGGERCGECGWLIARGLLALFFVLFSLVRGLRTVILLMHVVVRVGRSRTRRRSEGLVTVHTRIWRPV